MSFSVRVRRMGLWCEDLDLVIVWGSDLPVTSGCGGILGSGEGSWEYVILFSICMLDSPLLESSTVIDIGRFTNRTLSDRFSRS